MSLSKKMKWNHINHHHQRLHFVRIVQWNLDTQSFSEAHCLASTHLGANRSVGPCDIERKKRVDEGGKEREALISLSSSIAAAASSCPSPNFLTSSSSPSFHFSEHSLARSKFKSMLPDNDELNNCNVEAEILNTNAHQTWLVKNWASMIDQQSDFW